MDKITATKMKTITVDGIEYVPASSVKNNPAKTLKGKKYVIVRTYSAGVFAGYLDSRVGKEVVLLNARRLWYWSGAASLSQLAMEGVKKIADCKFAMEVNRIELTEAVEIIDATKEAQDNISSVPVWRV